MAQIKKIFEKQDMREGQPWKKVLLFSIPLLLGNIAQQLYSTVDSIVVGQYVGDNALKAIGSSMPIVMLIMVFFIMIGTGSSIMVSQYFGANERENLSKAVGTSLSWTFILSLVLMVLGLLITEPILRLTNTPESYFQWSKEYLYIYFIGVHGLSFYNIVAGILRGLGDSVSSTVFVLIAAMLNIILDLFFVLNLGMGVAGVAIATVISQFSSAILAIFRLRKYTDFDMAWRYLIPDGMISKNLFSLGIPSGITQGVFSMAMLFVQNLTNTIDIADINMMVMRVDGFAMLPNFTFGIAMATFAGQNIGAGQLDRVKKGRKEGLILAMGITAFLTLMIIIFGKNILGLFTRTPEKIDLAYSMMMVLAGAYVVFTITQVLSGIMRGAGDTMTPMWTAIFVTTMIRVPSAYTIAHFTKNAQWPHGQPIAIFGSLALAWTCGAIITSLFYKKGNWQKKALVHYSSKR